VPPVLGGPGDPIGGGSSRADLHRLVNGIQRAQGVNAVNGLSQDCKNDLAAHGIDANKVAVTASTTEYYDEYFEGDLKISDIVVNLDTRTLSTALAGNVAISLVNSSSQPVNKVALSKTYFTTVGFGPDLATSQNITLAHEALHNSVGLLDKNLAQKMGLGVFATDADASLAISHYLEGCYK
jgi:hypothetical protein